MKLKTEEIAGVKFDVEVDERGWFSFEHAGTAYCEERLEDLAKHMHRAAARAKVRVEVPFTMLGDRFRLGRGKEPILRNGVATGLNSRTGYVLVRWTDDGSAEQIDASYGMSSARLLSGDEAQEYERLYEEMKKSRDAYDAFVSARRLDLKKAVRAAIEEASAKESTDVATGDPRVDAPAKARR